MSINKTHYLPLRRYHRDITGTNYTNRHGWVIPYQIADGSWRCLGNGYGTTSVATADLTLTIPGITFQVDSIQAGTLVASPFNDQGCSTTAGASTIRLIYSGATTEHAWSFDVALKNKPTFLED